MGQFCGSWRVAQAFDLAGITNTVGAQFVRVFCEGRESEMPAPVRLITCPQQNQMAHAASPPTLTKNARMGHPQWEWCTQRSLKVATRHLRRRCRHMFATT